MLAALILSDIQMFICVLNNSVEFRTSTTLRHLALTCPLNYPYITHRRWAKLTNMLF